ncbi:hypothetical protein BN59_01686 [Legionella massiliensis]|uniref:Uncharacterized protein n=1 Tax=Legionella massiliensis TaxID=1034943 RepID=A0A078L029_9GAMM|nr:hypothetical protein [Legionella massiliensis]CDZ77403.1 hypothetical protein BN59_01686 [Legionella massiliensis]CEE13141.1 hypothetical protein BN1094_01686 [Legionella massiliensis]
MQVIIKQLVKKLFSYTGFPHNLYADVGPSDGTIHYKSQIVLMTVHREYHRLETSDDLGKQRKMISLFLGGTIYTMLQDELRYGYNIGAHAIAQETWKHVERSDAQNNEGRLQNIYAIGDYVLANLSILPEDFYTRGRKYLRGNTDPFAAPEHERAYFWPLASNIEKMKLLLQFCFKYKDNLELPEIDSDDLANVQILEGISNVPQRIISGETVENRPVGQRLTRDNIDDNHIATITTKAINLEEFGNSSPRFFSSRSEDKQESQNWDFAHPSTGMIILAACVPVIGWAYLLFVLFNALAESCCINNESCSRGVSASSRLEALL